MDIFAAERLPCYSTDAGQKPESADLFFPSYSVRRLGDNLLKDRCRLQLKVERNLDKYGCVFLTLVLPCCFPSLQTLTVESKSRLQPFYLLFLLKSTDPLWHLVG